MATSAQRTEPNDALGLFLIAMIVMLSAAGIYLCSVHSYKFGSAVIVPPEYTENVVLGHRSHMPGRAAK